MCKRLKKKKSTTSRHLHQNDYKRDHMEPKGIVLVLPIMSTFHPNLDINVALSLGQPPAPAPPTRKRRRRPPRNVSIKQLSDLEAWGLKDTEICSEHIH